MPDRIVVADASAIAALLFGEPQAPDISDRLVGATIAAPTLLPYEIASVCLKKLALHPGKRNQILEALALLDLMRIRSIPVPPVEAVALARQVKLTAYDAAYLWLARNLKVDLVTLDMKLEKAARKIRSLLD